MKVSVIMIDGGFRDNVYGAEYFGRQDFPADEFEVLWVEHFDTPHPRLSAFPKVRTICLGRPGVYHSSYCFNRGISEAAGEVVVIPDADQIVGPDFLSRVWDLHCRYEKLVVYGYRYGELEESGAAPRSVEEASGRCRVLGSPNNYGACLTVRKQWLTAINGYEQHPLFQSGNHANGLDVYTRLKNYGLAVQWEPGLRLYHPWHPFSLMKTREHEAQGEIIEWRRWNLQWKAFRGIDKSEDAEPPEHLAARMAALLRELDMPAGTSGGEASWMRRAYWRGVSALRKLLCGKRRWC